MTDTVPRGFREREFFNQFKKLIEENEAEAALTYLINALPGLQESRINRKEKLKQLIFAGRMLQAAGLGKHGYRKLLDKARSLRKVIATHGLRNRKTFVDFGCGAHEPLAMSTYFYLNGFEQAIANDMLEIRDPEYSAFSMYDIVANMRLFPDHYRMDGTTETDFLDRLETLGAEAFSNGDFEGGFAPLDGKVRFESCNIMDLGIEEGSVSFLISFAVFEHVSDVAGVNEYIFEHMEPGGLCFHYIDLADHRSYRADGEFNEFTFLTEQDGPANINRLRKSEQLAAFQAAGFEVLEVSGNRISVPEATRAAFLPKWAAMSEEDQETRSMQVVLRRPE